MIPVVLDRVRRIFGYLTANASGNFSGTLTVSGVNADSTKVTGTATDTNGNTSEFGANELVTGPASKVVYSVQPSNGTAEWPIARRLSWRSRIPLETLSRVTVPM